MKNLAKLVEMKQDKTKISMITDMTFQVPNKHRMQI